MAYKIPWYMKDARFKAGTVADVGDVRIAIRKTDRETNNKWRVYLSNRTYKENGVKDSLKREICVAQYSGLLTLEEVQEKAGEYLEDFAFGILAEMSIREGTNT